MYSEEEKRAITKFLKDEKRICEAYLKEGNAGCGDCELYCDCQLAKAHTDTNEEFKTVEEWANEHRAKTNFDDFCETIGDSAVSYMNIKSVEDAVEIIMLQQRKMEAERR